MRGAIPPPQYAFIPWCSVKKHSDLVSTSPQQFLLRPLLLSCSFLKAGIIAIFLKGVHEKIKYHLTAWSRVLYDKLIVIQMLNKFSAFFGSRRFITVFTRVSHWSLS
jgi:hypothetical protein